MNADQLLAHYEQVADAPDAIPRLRRFILDLAVRGKLVEQDPADEPASELLKRVEAEKARLVNAGKIRKKAASDPIMVDAPFDLPRNWAWVSIGTAFLYDAGAKRGPKALDQSLWLLELENIEKDTGRLVLRVRSAEGASQSTKSEFLPGDILYGKLRPYLNKVLVADEPGYSTTEIVAIRPYLPLCSEYCALALRRPDFVKYVTRLGQGTKMPRLRTEDAVVAPFPLPPLAEQHRIAAKVDELMALCDRLEAARAEREATRDRLTAASLVRLDAPDPDPATFRVHAAFALENLAPLTTRLDQIKVLRQTILNLAVRGKLVEQDPKDEPAAELFGRLHAHKAEHVEPIELKREAKFAATREAPPFELPQSWIVVSLREIVQNLGDGLHGTPEYSPDGDAYFINGNNLRDGVIEVFPNTKMVSAEEYKKHAKPLMENSVLVSINGTLGNVAFYQGERVVLGKSACYFELSPFVPKNFMKLLIQSPYFVDYAFSQATGTTIKNLSLKAMNSFPVPLPPLAEQHRIVATVDELMALCDRLETSLDTADTTRQRLLEALLHEALVPGEKQEEGARATPFRSSLMIPGSKS